MLRSITVVLATAFLFWLSFPKPDLGFFGFIVLLPLLFSIQNKNKIRTFAYGWLHGFAAYCAILYWIVPTIMAAGQTLWLGLLALFCLAAYLAVYIGLFSLIISYFLPLSKPLLVPIFGAAVWVSLEYARTYVLSGFPWALLGYTQWKYLPVIQISEFTGVYGVSFLVVLVNFGLYTLIQHVIASIAKQSHTLRLLRYARNDDFKNFAIPLIFTIFVISFGTWKLHFATLPQTAPIKIAILQGNIDQYKKWDEAYTYEIMDTYTALAKQAADFSPDLVVWPETAVPGWLPQERKYLEWARQAVKLAGGWHLVGTPSTNRGKDYNSAFLFGPEGFIAAEYHKTHLVPFGETIPFRAVLSPWIRVLNELGDFDAGSNLKPLYSDVADVGTNICFEAIFPDLVRMFAYNGADVLVNMTNDAWYLDTAGPYQHFIMNVLRAVENRRPLIRAANTGISGAIDQYGHIVAKSELLQKGVLFATLTLPSPLGGDGVGEGKTFYTVYGDVFAWACAVLTIFGLIKALWKTLGTLKTG